MRIHTLALISKQPQEGVAAATARPHRPQTLCPFDLNSERFSISVQTINVGPQ